MTGGLVHAAQILPSVQIVPALSLALLSKEETNYSVHLVLCADQHLFCFCAKKPQAETKNRRF